LVVSNSIWFFTFIDLLYQQSDVQFSVSLSNQLKIKNVYFSPLLVFSTNNRTNSLVSDYQLVIRKDIRSIAFAHVVGGKHQTTADELGTPTRTKISDYQVVIIRNIHLIAVTSVVGLYISVKNIKRQQTNLEYQ
jgi:hypothetical protein